MPYTIRVYPGICPEDLEAEAQAEPIGELEVEDLDGVHHIPINASAGTTFVRLFIAGFEETGPFHQIGTLTAIQHQDMILDLTGFDVSPFVSQED